MQVGQIVEVIAAIVVALGIIAIRVHAFCSLAGATSAASASTIGAAFYNLFISAEVVVLLGLCIVAPARNFIAYLIVQIGSSGGRRCRGCCR